MKFLTRLILLSCIVCTRPAMAQVSCNLSLQAQPVGTSCSNLCTGSVILTPSGGTAPYSFNAFDHSFPGSSIDTSVFDVRNGNFSVSNNQLTAKPISGVANDYDNTIATKQVFNATNKIVAEASFFIDYNTYGNWGLAENAVITDQSQLPFSFFFNYGTLCIMDNGNLTQIGGYSSNTWYDFKIEKIGATINYYMRSTGLTTYALIGTKTTPTSDAGYKLAATYYNFNTLYGGYKTMNWKIGGNPPMSNLCTGTYTYTVFDAVGCYATATVTIGVDAGPGSLQLAGTVAPASCGAVNDGSVTLTPTGGTAPYSYGLFQNFQGSSINTNIFELRNGNFSQGIDLREGVNYSANTGWDNSIATRYTFSDGGYLKFEGSFKFDANADVIFGFAANATIDDYSKMMVGFRVSNGSLLYAYTSTGGLKPLPSISADTWYDFKIEKTGTTVKYYYRPYATGSYTLLTTSTYTNDIIEYKLAALNNSGVYSSAAGYNTKGWAVDVTPRTSQLAPGTYTYTITDAVGCTATSVFNVSQLASGGITLNATVVKASVVNGATGEVSLTPLGGTAPYTYQFQYAFAGTAVNTSLFALRNGAFSESGILHSNTTTGNQTWDNSIATKFSFSDAAYISYAGSFKFDVAANVWLGLTTNATLVTDQTQMELGFNVNGTQLTVRAGLGNNTVMGTITPGTWYDLKIEKIKGLVKFYIRNTGNAGYTLLYTAQYSGSTTEFKAGVIALGSNAGFDSKNWIVNSNPQLTGLSAGIYNYRVYDAKGCYASVSVNVPSSGSFAVTAQPVNSAAWNICDGSVSLTSNMSGNLAMYSNLYTESFSGSQLNTNDLDARNGAYSVNASLSAGNVYNTSNWDNSIVTKKNFADNGYLSAEMDMNFHAASEVYFGFAPASQVVNTYSNLPFAFYYASGKLYAYTAESGNKLVGGLAAGNWYGFKIEKTGNTVTFYIKQPGELMYEQVYATATTATAPSYKAGLVNYFDQVSADRSFSSRNWRVMGNAPATALCLGSYSYYAAVTGTQPYPVSFTVGTNLPIVATMTAPADVVVNTNPGVAYATGVALGTPGFGGNPTGLVTVGNNAPAQFGLGTTIVTWHATDIWGYSQTGTQKVTVKDNEAPSITAPAALNIVLSAGQTVATGVNLGTPVVSDNAPNPTFFNNAPAQFPIGTTIVTWTAKDAAGNTATATQTVTVIASQLPAVTAPADVTVTTDAGKPYASSVNLGTPTLTGGNVSNVIVTNNAPAQFYIGTTNVTWTVSDGAGTSITVIQKVTVVDQENPVITAPAGITVNTNAGVAYATNVNIGSPVYSDNVPGVTVSNNAPAQFPLGNTTVTWTAKDASGNTATATQVVTVKDAEAPAVIAPADITVNTNAGVAFATGVALGTPVTTDNVGVTSITSNAPAQFSLGTTTISWTVKDAAGNTSIATQKVTVKDNEAPAVTAPAAITVGPDAGTSYATNVNLGSPVATDNVGVVSVTNNAPLQYPVGATTVTWTVKDAAGNTTTATQVVTVDNTQPPVFTSVTANVTVCYQQFGTYAVPAVTAVNQNGGAVTYSYVIAGATTRSGSGNNASGAFNSGVSVITWTATNQYGKSATATTTVTVNQSVTVNIPASTVLAVWGVQPNTIYIGYDPASELPVSATATGGTAPYNFSWSAGSSNLAITNTSQPNTVNLTSVIAGAYSLSATVTDSKGCAASYTTTINVKDVRCGSQNSNNTKVSICHRTNSANNPWVQICVDENAVPAHLASGAILGSCNTTASRASSAVKPDVAIAAPSIRAYPNPNNGVFQLQLVGQPQGKVVVQVIDALGRTVFSKSTTVSYQRENMVIDLQKFAQGIYKVRVLNQAGAVQTISISVAY